MRSLSGFSRVFVAFSILLLALTAFSFINGNRISKSVDAAYRNTLAATLSATKTGALDTSAGGDANGNGVLNPGDRLKYRVVISNSSSDATGINFSDPIDGNTTYVSGSIIASPVAVNESYSTIGNVSITVPAASGVLVNDLNANTGAACSVGNTCTITTTGSFLSANGANVTLNADGSFTFNPKAGFEGADTFSYTLSNGTGLTDAAIVTVNVSGMIWFVNNNAGACSASCDGRLSNPFTTLNAFNTANALSGGSNPDTNDNIFIYESPTQYTGAVTLRTAQKLIGQDATATLQTIAGITTIPSFSAALPTMNSGNATTTNIGSTVTLNTNATLRGFSINSTTSTGINDPAGAITNITTSEIYVTATTGTAILLSDAGGTLSFTKVSANGAANGISLTNTTGSFTVTGSSTGNCGGDAVPAGTATSPDVNDCTGGTIQNTVGADLTTSGIGIYLNNAQNVSLTRIKLNDHQNFAIRGANVNGFILNNVYITGSNGTSTDNGAGTATNEGSVSFDNLTGVASVTESYIEGGYTDNFRIINTSGSLNRITFTGDTIGFNGNLGNSGILSTGYLNATINLTVQNSRFKGSRANNMAYILNDSSSGDFVFAGNNLKNSHPNKVTGGTGLNAVSASSGAMTYNISNNSVNDSEGSGIEADRLAGGTDSVTGSITNNTVGSSGVANSGSKSGSGIFVGLVGAPAAGVAATHTATVSGNVVRQFANYGITLVNRGTGAGYLNASVSNNNVAEPTAASVAALFPTSGIRADLGAASHTGEPGNTGPDDGQSCLNIKSNILSNTGTNGGPEIRIRARFSTITGLPGLTGTADSFLAAQNTISTSGTPVTATSTNPFQNTCPTPVAALQNKAVNSSSLNLAWLLQNSGLNSSQNRDVGLSESKNKLADDTLPAIQKLPIAASVTFRENNTSSALKNWFDAITSDIHSLTNYIIPSANAEEKMNTAHLPAVLAGETVTKSLGTLPMNETITVQFTAAVNSTPSTFYSVSNTANITAAGGVSINSTTATNTVVQPPSIGKAFGASFIATNNTTSLTYTITNGNAAALTGLSFNDALPAGLVINTPNNLSNTCGGTVTAVQNTSAISLSGGSVNPNATCTVKVDVKGTVEGAKTSQTNNVSSTNGGSGNAATATLNIINTPTFTKAFGAPTIPLNGSTSLSFTITNASQTFPLNNVSFTDTLPAGIIVSTPNALTGSCGGGTITANQGANSISLSGAVLTANADCTFSVSVSGTTAGLKNNTATLLTTELGAGATATASVTVLSPATIAKAFSPTTIPSGGTSTVTLTLSNGNAANALTGATFTDTLVKMSAAGGTVGGTCAGTTPNALAAGATSLSFSGITIPAAGSCTVTFNVTSNVAGVNPNTTGAISSANGGTGAASNTANLTVIAPPQITKSFSPDTILLNGISTLTITLTNPAANTVALTGVGVVDNFPAGLQVDQMPAATTSCGGTFAPAANAAGLTISNATVPVGGICAFSVKVKGTTVGAKVNTTNAVTSVNGGTGPAAAATLTVNAPTYSISGSVSYGTTPTGNPAKFVSSVLMSATGASSAFVNTDATGIYSLDNLTAGGQYTVIPTKSGDINGINSFDATTVLRYLAAGQNGSLTTNQQVAADTNGDGLINSFDATQILRFLSANGQQSAATGAVGNWKFKPSARNYQSLNGSLTNENYEAILVGEVSGDWTNGVNSNVNSSASTIAGEKLEQAEDSAVSLGSEATVSVEQPNEQSEISQNGKSLDKNLTGQTPTIATATDIQISLPANATGTMNSTVVVPITVANSSGSAVSGFNLGVTFNPNVLMLDTTAIDTTGTLLNGNNPTIDTSTAGRIGIAAANLNITAASGTLLNLRFKVIGAANSATTGTTALTFEQLTTPTISPSFQSDTGANLTIGAANGNFTVTLAPTAASVSISGRILNDSGKGINRARIMMTGISGETQYATTNPFGYFRFANVPAGETYIFTVSHKQYQFAPQVLNLTEDFTDLNFTGLSIKRGDEIK